MQICNLTISSFWLPLFQTSIFFHLHLRDLKYLVKYLPCPQQMSKSLTFPGFPDKWSPCLQMMMWSSGTQMTFLTANYFCKLYLSLNRINNCWKYQCFPETTNPTTFPLDFLLSPPLFLAISEFSDLSGFYGKSGNRTRSHSELLFALD